MKFTDEEKDIIHRVHLLSGKSYEETEKMFRAFCEVAVMAYLEKEPIHIPLFGALTVKYVDDTLTPEGREANIEVSVEPSRQLKRIIGQIEDKDESDIEKELQTEISKLIEKLV